MNRWPAWAFLLIVAGALALRLPQLNQRPMHNDEGVNAIKFRELWEQGTYRYDPDEYHGPTLYYATLAAARLSLAPDFADFTEARLRIVPVLFGLGLVLLLPLIRDGLGQTATLVAALLTALSPAMVFYSRYYIHEMLLVFFTLLLVAAGWRYTRTKRVGWALVGGAALGLMHATKETFIIGIGAIVTAVLLTMAWGRWLDKAPVNLRRLLVVKHLLLLLGVAAFVSVAFFSSFFSNPQGPLDSLRTYLPWLGRAGGDSPHIHPWHFYLERLAYYHPGRGPVWSEGLILGLAVAGLIAGLTRKGIADAHVGCVRFIGFYTVILTVAYGVISYKTPWCVLGFLHGMILLAGVGAVAVVRLWPRKPLNVAVAVVLGLATCQLAFQAWRTSFRYAADRQNPYVYAHTSPDLLGLADKLEGFAKVSPNGYQMVVQVMAPDNDYWPLPWYLRRFPQVGWWNRAPTDPLVPFSPVMIISTKFKAFLDEKPEQQYLMAGYYQLRPGTFFELYVHLDLWRDCLEKFPPPLDE